MLIISVWFATVVFNVDDDPIVEFLHQIESFSVGVLVHFFQNS